MAGNSSSLTFKLFGKDVSASKAFASVGRSAETVNRGIGGLAKGAGIALAGIGAAAAVAGTALAVDFAGKAISSASDMNETLSKTSVIFGKNSAALVKWSATAAAAMGQSQQQALDAASTFATFGKSAGLSGKSLVKFAEQNAQLASDMASFFNTSPEQAIEAIGAAFRGEAEPMRAYGVLLDDASMRQQALKMHLIKTTKQALTPQQKVLAAQALIMKQTTSAQGDFARTSGGLANQQRILSAGWSNMTAKIGAYFLPIALKVVSFLNANLIPTVTAVTDGIKIFFDAFSGNSEMNEFDGALQTVNNAGIAFREVWDAVGGWITGTLLPVIRSLADGFMKNIWPAIQQVAATVAENLQPVIEALVAFWNDTLYPAIVRMVPVFATIAKVIGIVAGAVLLLVSWLLGKLVPIVLRVIGVFTTFATSLMSKVGAAIEWVIEHFGEIVEFFKSIPGKIGGFFSHLANVITAPFRIAFNSIASLWNNTVGALSFSVPDWVPGLGGKGWDVPDIPMLANGGIVTRPTLALIGESGPEAVIPLNRRNGAGGVVINITHPLGTPEQIARAVNDALRRGASSGRANIKYA
jgi:hypothetical protein